jgi:hypothetical protein
LPGYHARDADSLGKILALLEAEPSTARCHDFAVSSGPHPLAKDRAVQDAWDVEFRHSYQVLASYSMIVQRNHPYTIKVWQATA